MLTRNSENSNLLPLRHTAEHILQAAMQELYPNIKRVMGPPIEEGFYFDFDLEERISEADFAKIEEMMDKVIAADLPMTKVPVSQEEARELFADNKYKLDLLDEIKERGEEITLYVMGGKGDRFYYADLCIGPHVKSTGDVKAIKLLGLAGAYYKGDEKNKMLQRIYGTAFENKAELGEYVTLLQKRKDNDHRELNKILDIFATSELVGKGFILYTPNGTIIKNELKNHLLTVCKKYGAKEVDIPHLAKIDLYQKSGHAEKFKDELFKVVSHYDEEFVLKPVNCPHHTQIYASRPRSYKDLPIAYVESTQQHRDEKPGAIGGLNRARSFEIDDGHTFCTPDQIKAEAIKILTIMKEFYEVFGMWGKHWVSLSFRDPKTPEKYIGDEAGWNTAQHMLLEINTELNLNGKIMEGEAALYGPKIDIMLKDALGNDRQLGTVQIDFAMPGRFGLVYTDKDGIEKTPVMLHRAILGSYHRFIANLLENTGGALPLWLSPVQIALIPISESHHAYASEIERKFKEEGLRVEVFDRDDTMQSKIRDAQMRKIPYMFVLGDREVSNKQVSVRTRDNVNVGAVDVDFALSKIKNIYLTKSLDLW
jgi:threonyl-tRNA synthetase